MASKSAQQPERKVIMRPSLPPLVILALLCGSSPLALAAEAEGPSTTPMAGHAAARLPAQGAPPAKAANDKDLNFDFFAADNQADKKDGAANRDADEVAARASRRRWMLKVHQTLGLATWALMAATVTVGQLNYNQIYGDGSHSTKWQGPHKALVASTSIAFAGTGAFAIFAPKPYDRPLKFDTGLVHRIAVIGATLGMVSEIVLGITTRGRAEAGNPRSLKTLARTHQIIGYSTFGFLTVAATVWVF
jgi:hypothetical protein